MTDYPRSSSAQIVDEFLNLAYSRDSRGGGTVVSLVIGVEQCDFCEGSSPHTPVFGL